VLKEHSLSASQGIEFKLEEWTTQREGNPAARAARRFNYQHKRRGGSGRDAISGRPEKSGRAVEGGSQNQEKRPRESNESPHRPKD